MRQSCTILGGGPSLKDFDWSTLEGKDCICINNAMFKLPSAIGYFTDVEWFKKWEPEIVARRGRTIRGCLPGEELNCTWIEQWPFTAVHGLVTAPRCLAHGHNSGYAAINLAVALGYRTIELLGYDMSAVNGSNFHTTHERTTPEEAYARQFLPSFQTLVEPLKERDVTVVNATPNSALTVFPAA